MAIINSALDNVYNYYQTTLSAKSSSRYDAHKKSELKDHYNSIINNSKEEPVFLLTHSRDIERYTIGMKESALAFSRDISAYTDNDTGKLFEKKSAYSSDMQKATCEYINNNDFKDEAATSEDSITLDIMKIAKPQINQGRYLTPNAIGVDTGSYSFDVATASSNYELQFSINDNDTNQTIQTRLARLINNSGIGLKASVSVNNQGESALVISSQSSGAVSNDQRPFEISDENTSQKSGIIDYLGIRIPSQEATWSEYAVNGEYHTAPDNDIIAAGQYAISLKATTAPGEPVTIGIKPDYEALSDNIIGITASYNSFMRTAVDFLDKQPRTGVLIDSMKKMTNYYMESLSPFGISQDSVGILDIDKDKLADTLASSGDINAIEGLKDFTQSALRKINRVSLNPMDYVDKRIVAYKNPNKTHYANPYLTSAYSGMMFNGYM